MARTALTIQTPPNLNATIGALGAQLLFTAADTVNFNSFVASGREIVIVYNSAASAGTVTINSVADQLGRTADITAYSIPATSYAFFGPFPLNGWAQTTVPKTINLQGSAATITFAVVQLPAGY